MKFRPTIMSAGTTIMLTAAALLFSAPAQAYVVCNDDGDCWHASKHYDVPNVHVTFYEDNWDWKSHHDRWHDADADDAPGYWDTHENKWVTVQKTTTTTTSTSPQ